MTTDFPIPQTQYAESDGLSIAYQVFGSGTQDLIIVPGIVSHLDGDWEDPDHARMWRRLAQSFRVIVFDKRGQGLSDRFEGVPTLEQRMDDVRAVMQAANSPRAVIFAHSEGGAMSALFTATYPAMVSRLVLFGSFARYSAAPDYPHRRTLEEMLVGIAKTWGTAEFVARLAASRADDAEYCARAARLMRQVASPSAMKRMLIANNQIDVRAILPQIRRPALVLQRRHDAANPCGNGRYLADHIPETVYVEYPGADHLWWIGDADSVVDAIVRFAGAEQAQVAPEPTERFVTTVLFTDIVGSTELATKLGDAKWRDLLRDFHALGRRQLEPHRGREIDTAGDGLFAIFDGPARAIRCATAIAHEAKTLGIDVRAGLHTGEVEPTGGKVSGMAVHIGARVMALAGTSEVLISSTTRDLVSGSGIEFEARGAHALKGVPGEWQIFRANAS
jgi:class 3 adenylate cyclase/pimeloyl-ACP methyl ester carboxylesterase